MRLLVNALALVIGLLANPALARASAACGALNQACCQTAAPCGAELGCSRGVCKSIITDTVAYANYCKQELGFVDPKAKLDYMSCYDSAAADGTRVTTGRQADIRLSIREGDTARMLRLRDNGPAIRDGRDLWDHVFGQNGAESHGCDNPNYLHGGCDPYYRLNVWKPDAGGNERIVAALHCRDGSDTKPRPSNAVTASARLEALRAAPDSTPLSERQRLFQQYNDSSEIVLILANTDTGKSCFFHAKRPYFGSYIPAPDDERDVRGSDAAEQVWSELPVKPPYGANDMPRRSEWLRNAESAWQTPDYMSCTGCHDSGPFMHNPFIDSMNDGGQYLPTDRRNRPYIPLGYQARSDVSFIKTDPVRSPFGGTEEQLCTACHQLGNSSACSNWADRALGWSFPSTASEESKRSQALKRYMPVHTTDTTEEFYQEYGAHIDAMRCCCENPDWAGCRTVDRATPMAEGTRGTDPRSCVASTLGGWGQQCLDDGQCNHSGLQCDSGTCRYADE